MTLDAGYQVIHEGLAFRPGLGFHFIVGNGVLELAGAGVEGADFSIEAGSQRYAGLLGVFDGFKQGGEVFLVGDGLPVVVVQTVLIVVPREPGLVAAVIWTPKLGLQNKLQVVCGRF